MRGGVDPVAVVKLRHHPVGNIAFEENFFAAVGADDDTPAIGKIGGYIKHHPAEVAGVGVFDGKGVGSGLKIFGYFQHRGVFPIVGNPLV